MHRIYHNRDKNSHHGQKIENNSTQEENKHANHRKWGNDTRKTHWHSRSAINTKPKTQTSPAYHQHLKTTYHRNTWTQGWLRSHVLSPQVQRCIFSIFHM